MNYPRLKSFFLGLIFVGFYSTLEGQNIQNSSYVLDDERIIKQSFEVNAALDDVWKAWTTEEGLGTWFAPVVAVDWKRGGTIKSRYKVGGKIGERNTVVSEIVDYLPMQRLVLKDDLVFLLSYGMSQNWIEDVSNKFMFEIIADGGDIFTTTEFESLSDETTRVTVYMTGYGTSEEWDKRYESSISANLWTYNKAIKRFETGPVNWNQIK